MANGYWTRWVSASKKWEASTDGGATFADVVENLTTEQVVANPVAAPSGIASKGIIYYDSTANKWRVKENNGTAANIASPQTTKGDLTVFGTTESRLAVGSNYQHLVPDSAQSLGVKYYTPPTCSVSKSAQAITTATWTVVTWDSEWFDPAGMHSNTVNNSRITVPIAGKYLVFATISFVNHATGQRQVYLRIDGGNAFLGGIAPINSGTNYTTLAFGHVITLNANQYVEIAVYQDSGGNLNVGAESKFSLAWIGD